MKIIATLTLLLGVVVSTHSAETSNDRPTLVTIATAKAKVSEGFEAFQKVMLPRGIRISPTPRATDAEVEVQILRFDHENVPTDQFVATLSEELDSSDFLKILDEAGFRPATLEEMLAARPKFHNLKRLVSVYGSKARLNDKYFHFSFDFVYKMDTDILQYTDGAILGLFPADWQWRRSSVAIAAVKK